VVVPCNRGNFVELRTAVSGRVRLRRIFEIPDINLERRDSASRVYAVVVSPNLSIDSTGRKKVWLNRIEVEATNGACMCFVSQYQGFTGPGVWSDLVRCRCSRF
jgi:hypothetical protein